MRCRGVEEHQGLEDGLYKSLLSQTSYQDRSRGWMPEDTTRPMSWHLSVSMLSRRKGGWPHAQQSVLRVQRKQADEARSLTETDHQKVKLAKSGAVGHLAVHPGISRERGGNWIAVFQASTLRHAASYALRRRRHTLSPAAHRCPPARRLLQL